MDTGQFRPQTDKVATYTHAQITGIFCQHLTKAQDNNKNPKCQTSSLGSQDTNVIT